MRPMRTKDHVHDAEIACFSNTFSQNQWHFSTSWDQVHLCSRDRSGKLTIVRKEGGAPTVLQMKATRASKQRHVHGTQRHACAHSAAQACSRRLEETPALASEGPDTLWRRPYDAYCSQRLATALLSIRSPLPGCVNQRGVCTLFQKNAWVGLYLCARRPFCLLLR